MVDNDASNKGRRKSSWRHCDICKEVPYQYKCPTCYAKYCSLRCFRVHKGAECVPAVVETQVVATPKEEANVVYEYETEDTVPYSRLVKLEESASIRQCLKNPHLRSLLQELDASESPAPVLDQLMREPIFTELVDECLKVVKCNYTK